MWRLAVAGALGAGAALLVACGASGKNLLPVADAGALQSDFNAISTAVSNGDCTGAAQAIAKAQADLLKLPATVDPRLRARLEQGLADLAQRAPTECQQNTPSTQATTPATTATTTTTPTTTTPTTTDTTTTPTDGSGGTPPATSGGGGGGAGAGGALPGAGAGPGSGAGGTPGQ